MSSTKQHSVSVWNGASFYFKIMSNSKEVASLKKELEALQKEIDGSKTPASVASYGTLDSTEPVDEDVSLGPSAVASPEFGPGGTGASGALANAAVSAKDEQQPASSNSTNADTPRTGTATRGDASNNSAGKESGQEEPTIAMKRDQSIPSLKLDDYETESSNQSQAESNSNDAMSDSSAVVVDAEDGQPQP